MTSRSLSNRQLSRSKLSLFLECRRCFYDDVVHGAGRVPSFPLSLNNAVDRLLKVEFDAHRAAGTPHPLFASVGLDATPFAHADLNRWRTNFTGVRWTDPETGWTLFGAVDDVWVGQDRKLIVADYKATSRARDIGPVDVYPSYLQQLEVYQFLVAHQGFEVHPRAWLLYANANADAPGFDASLSFRMSLVPCDGDPGWVEGRFREAVGLLASAERPSPADDCKWCRYVHDRSTSRP